MSSIDAGNVFLRGFVGSFNERFAVQPAKQALVFAMPEGQQHSLLLDVTPEIKPEREISIGRGYGFGIGLYC